MTDTRLLIPDWNLPEGIKAFVTTRQGGLSRGAYSSFNLGLHVQDSTAAVLANRAALLAAITDACQTGGLRLQWLQQVHGTDVFDVIQAGANQLHSDVPIADAAYCTVAGVICGVLTADCLPVLLCSDDGQEIAVAHAGWRGLVNGVLEQTLARFKAKPAAISAWLGPAIGPCHFEVGAEVRQAFLDAAKGLQVDESVVDTAFTPAALDGKYLANLYQLARLRLQGVGVVNVTGDVQCTVCEDQKWYSYRRQPVTGRFATLIVRIS